MELTIWKYNLPTAWEVIDMPQGAKVLTVQMQRDAPVLYALVDPAQPPEVHELTIHGTGHPIMADEVGQYVGTFQDGWYVGHVFDRVHPAKAVDNGTR